MQTAYRSHGKPYKAHLHVTWVAFPLPYTRLAYTCIAVLALWCFPVYSALEKSQHWPAASVYEQSSWNKWWRQKPYSRKVSHARVLFFLLNWSGSVRRGREESWGRWHGLAISCSYMGRKCSLSSSSLKERGWKKGLLAVTWQLPSPTERSAASQMMCANWGTWDMLQNHRVLNSPSNGGKTELRRISAEIFLFFFFNWSINDLKWKVLFCY